MEPKDRASATNDDDDHHAASSPSEFMEDMVDENRIRAEALIGEKKDMSNYWLIKITWASEAAS